MTRVIALLALAIPLAAVGAAPVPKHLMKEPMAYHPTEAGAKWVYTVQEPHETTGREVVEVVVAVHELPGEKGVKFVELGSIVDGKTHRSGCYLAVSEKGLVEGSMSAPMKFVPRTEPLRASVNPGTRWEVQIGLGRTGRKEVHTFRGEETVEVPGGKFTALRVDTVYEHIHAAWQHWRHWYAPGIGLVKSEREKGVKKVLKKFIPAGE